MGFVKRRLLGVPARKFSILACLDLLPKKNSREFYLATRVVGPDRVFVNSMATIKFSQSHISGRMPLGVYSKRTYSLHCIKWPNGLG
jgi:hypothetical protein